jgi:hypothetical protein
LLIGCLVIGALLLGGALLVPGHFRAVDAAVVEGAGKGILGPPSPSLVEEGVTFLSVEKLGPARMLLLTAQSEGVPHYDLLAAGLQKFARDNPSLVAWGGADPMVETINLSNDATSAPKPLVELLTRRVTREKTLQFLQQSRRPGVRQILQNRALTNTVHFPASGSASGQAIDAAIITAALLYQGDYFTPQFRETFEWLAMRANKGDNSSALELVYLDLLSLGRRLDWVSLTEFVKRIDNLTTLRDLAETMRTREDATANIFTAVSFTQNASAVAKYLGRYPETGLNDLNFALRHGRNAVEVLVKRQQRIHYGGFRKKIIEYNPFGAWFYAIVPTAVASQIGAIVLKYLMLFLAALCIARVIGTITAPLGHRFGQRFAADSVFALAITFVIGVALEPFLGFAEQANPFPVQFQLPSIAALTGFKAQPVTQSLMNQLSIVSLVTFFVIQALIYVWCLTKLAEIRRQTIEPRLKLRLLENEDLLFDAGLYVGFVGSVISLILMSIGIGKISMMAYASTSFGIIFVSVLKIFHVRPLRRKLIMESEAQAPTQYQTQS